MAIFANASYSDPVRALTLKALQQRQADQLKAQAAQELPTSMPSPWQGVAHVAGSIGDAMQMARTENALAAQRQNLAKIMSGIGESGPTAEQLAGVTAIDPDLGTKLLEQAATARQNALQRTHETGLEGQRGQQALTLQGATAKSASELEAQRGGQALTLQDRQAQSAKDLKTQEGEQALALQAAQEKAAKDLEAQRGGQALTLEERKASDARVLQGLQAQSAKDLAQQQGQQTQDLEKLKTNLQGQLPQSDVAKLGDDLRAGRITKEAHDAAVKKLTAPNPAEKKAGWEQESAYVDAHQRADVLREAQGLLDQGIHADIGGGVATMANRAVGWDKGKADRTVRFNQIMNSEAINSMVQALKGATTEKEMAEFKFTMNDPNASVDVKRRALQNMLDRVSTHAEIQGQRLDELGIRRPEIKRSETAMGGRGDRPGGAEAASTDPKALLDEARAAIAKGADRAAVMKRLKDKGVDPGGL